MYNWGGLLGSRMRNMWSLIFYLGRALPPLWAFLLFLFWSFSPQGISLLSFYPVGPHLLPASLSFSDIFSCIYLCNYFIMGPGRVPGLGTQEIFTEGVIGKSHLRGETLESVIWRDDRVEHSIRQPLESGFIHSSCIHFQATSEVNFWPNIQPPVPWN